MQSPKENRQSSNQRTVRITGLTFTLCLLLTCCGLKATAQSPESSVKRFDKDGLAFDYAQNWELIDQSNQAAQQLVLTENTLDAQIMIIALRGAITSSKQEEQAKAALIEPSVARLLKQYEDAAIKVERSPAATDISGAAAEGAKLRFTVDGQPGETDTCWLVINQRLVLLFFIRPEKTESKAHGSVLVSIKCRIKRFERICLRCLVTISAAIHCSRMTQDGSTS